jgi:hypothetical protein
MKQSKRGVSKAGSTAEVNAGHAVPASTQTVFGWLAKAKKGCQGCPVTACYDCCMPASLLLYACWHGGPVSYCTGSSAGSIHCGAVNTECCLSRTHSAWMNHSATRGMLTPAQGELTV